MPPRYRATQRAVMNNLFAVPPSARYVVTDRNFNAWRRIRAAGIRVIRSRRRQMGIAIMNRARTASRLRFMRTPRYVYGRQIYGPRYRG